jgi:ABC-2 type transport system ATP-binding protein
MTDLIAVRGVTKSFGNAPVLRGIDLTVARGEIVALLGPNGAGKTTLINILSTLVVPDGGTARIGGHDVVREPAAVKALISLTGQSAAVDEVLTGDENLRMMGRLIGLGRADAARRSRELLERFGLTASAGKRVKTYSGGMRRRLDLAISLLGTPPVVFLDEPTTGLDPASRQELWSVIRHLADNGTTVLLTTQYLEEADQLADRIAVLESGVIVAEGTPGDLKSRIGGEMVALHDADGAVLREIPTDGTVAGLRAALDALDDAATASVTLRRPSLDDVFLSLTGKDPK